MKNSALIAMIKRGLSFGFAMLAMESAQAHSPSLSISGISSGGFMAAQMGVIYSDQIQGVGTVAGGFYFCAHNDLNDKLVASQHNLLLLYQTQGNPLSVASGDFENAVEPAISNPLYEALTICMGAPALAQLTTDDVANAFEQNEIADPQNIQKQKFYFYQGQADTVVYPPMLNQLQAFYQSLNVPPSHIKFTQGVGGHNFPTDRSGEIDCSAQTVPFISSCGLDVAGEILTQLLAPDQLTRSLDQIENHKFLHVVSQELPASLGISRPPSIASYGYLAASPFCLKNPDQCDVHVALHGCMMSDSFDSAFNDRYAQAMALGQLQLASSDNDNSLPMGAPSLKDRVPRYGLLRFAADSGYLDYVPQNKLILLFPQTWIGENNFPLNPKGCWDWYGWTGPQYATQSGVEPHWLIHWISAIRQHPLDFIQNEPLHFSEADQIGQPPADNQP